MSKVQYFPVNVVLTIAHEKLLCDIGEVYRVCNFLTGDNLYTHQLPRAHDILQPWVLEQLPQLREWDESDITSENYRTYIEQAKLKFGESLPLTPLPPERWTYIDPIEEAKAMVGDDKVIAVDLTESAPPGDAETGSK
jgi:hypothetical protein